jgi:bifunctional UDP-N-acetylglucosamine pyrophosphorylase/glucosamine-1-phosphate N-acetyltransferase
MAFTTLVLAAGAGTRMKSERPKVVHEILGKPLVRWVIDSACEAGSEQVITVIGHGRELVEPLVKDTTLAYQDQLLGTGHAVMMARQAIEVANTQTLVVLSGDTPLLQSQTIVDLVANQTTSRAAACVLTFETDNPFGYGRIVRDGQGNFNRIVEQKDASPAEQQITEVNSGVYCFNVPDLLDKLDNLKADNAQNEYYLTDVLGLIIAGGGVVSTQKITDQTELLGINDRVQLATATAIAQQRINQRHMLNGVTIQDPRSVWIGPNVIIENDVEILPLTTLSGNTQIAWGSVIGPNSRINNSQIGRSCVVDESVLIDVKLEERVSVGPRAYLRPGTVMLQGSRAGTHVEIKKSTIGQNSKVPHLSYIGDAILGSDVNIGAGSITCNYDGINKNPTTIGDNTFIGSDTMLVAPIELGSDVVTGAGSVITKDVPDGSLAITRPKQMNIDAWPKKQGDR